MTGPVTRMVEAFEAIAPECNPHADAATAHLNRWVGEQGLIGRAAARERFDRAAFGWFAAITYPTASERDLGLVADWFAWLFLLDDQLDDGVLGRDPERTHQFLGALFGVLEGKGADPAGPSIVTSLADLWDRTTETASEAWRRRFVEHVVAGGLAAGWESANRVSGTIPGEADYVEKRRHTGAIYVCFDLIEIAEHLDVPAEVYDSEPFAEAVRAACDVVGWTNDLYSLDKETALGEYHNLVTVVQHARGIGQTEAIGVVAERITRRLREYLAAEPLIRKRHKEIEPYLAGLRSWMRGNLDWSASTRRYREALHDTENPASYLEPALIDRSAA
ncbi:terpene synthase family protein [Amycolatopsis albispora]|uniref:terpene synthase family protein n=1 Tax=Amycolatopsis albispora TaxID=1804986 RepID=UPI000DE54A53|nr:terpene cyclase [Amycolatopsis albispora]